MVSLAFHNYLHTLHDLILCRLFCQTLPTVPLLDPLGSWLPECCNSWVYSWCTCCVTLSRVKWKIATSYLLLALFALFVWLFCPIVYYPLPAPVSLRLYNTFCHSIDQLLGRFLSVVDCSVLNYSKVPILWSILSRVIISRSPVCLLRRQGEEEGDALGSVLGRWLGKVKNSWSAQPILRCNSWKSRGPNKCIAMWVCFYIIRLCYFQIGIS